jgi:hypothetical protein
MKFFLIVISLLAATAVMAAQPGDELWQQLIGAKEAQCAQGIVDAAREMNKLRAQVEDLQKQLAAAKQGAEKK